MVFVFVAVLLCFVFVFGSCYYSCFVVVFFFLWVDIE